MAACELMDAGTLRRLISADSSVRQRGEGGHGPEGPSRKALRAGELVSAGSQQRMLRVGFVERQLNRLLGILATRGLGPTYTYQLEVEGRRSGKRYSTPVNLMRRNGRLYLVAPRGWTQWVKNALACRRVRLVRGRSVQEFEVRLVPASERPPLLKDYLERYHSVVQRYFEVPAGSKVEAFVPLTEGYPVLELVPAGESEGAAAARS